MKWKVYEYSKCGTCRKAARFLEERGLEFTSVPIREQPPTKVELKRMLKIYGGDLRRLFNTSGLDYKKLGLSSRLARMSEEEALDLLSKNGNLVKRPFVLTETGGVVGFKSVEWERLK